jgi:hypothetical protein
MRPRNGVSVRVTTQAKKIANPVLRMVRTNARWKVFMHAAKSLGSVNAAIQPSKPHTVAWPGLLIVKLFKKRSTTGYASARSNNPIKKIIASHLQKVAVSGLCKAIRANSIIHRGKG